VVVLSWVLTTFHAMLHTVLMARLSFSEVNVIPHFSCDLSTQLKLTCSDTYANELVMLIMGGLVFVMSFLLIIRSCEQIVSSILKVPLLRVFTRSFPQVAPTCLWCHYSVG
jgi:olfactory receptor